MRNDVDLVPDKPQNRPGNPPGRGDADRNLNKVAPDVFVEARKADEPDGAVYDIPAVGSTTFTSALYWFIPIAIVVVLLIFGAMFLWHW